MSNTKNMEDKKAEIKKKAAKAIIAASTASSVVVGGLYSSPEDLIHPKPVIMNINEDEDFYDEHVRKEPTWRDKLRNYINNLPLIVRITIVLPLWAIGFLIISLTTNLWKMILNPILSHLSVWIIIAFVMLASLVAFGKTVFPKLKIKEFINRHTLITVGITVGILIVFHVIFINVWEDYETYMKPVYIATIAIGMVAGSYQLYHDFYQTKIVVSTENMTFEN